MTELSRQIRTICWCGEWRQHEHRPGDPPSTAGVVTRVTEAELAQWERLAVHAQQHTGVSVKLSPDALLALIAEVRSQRTCLPSSSRR